ncbi:MAG: cell division protein FtsA [Candidatus Portnoybacteria bacterium]|jgi:cell division protein FtsA|nr:cell division protein FtsA [Candidatus Portnoybacteria bacterium]
MSREKVIVGLDVGTCQIRVAVAQKKEGSLMPQVLAVSRVPTGGVRKGTVVDIDEVAKNIKEAVQQAERVAGVPIEHAFVGIGGSHILCRNSKGAIAVSRADGQISEEDKERALQAAKTVSLALNREIMHCLPRRFNVDGQEAIKNPVGMQGVRLELDALIIEGSAPFIKNLTKSVKEAGLDIDGIILTIWAASHAVLSKRQKELGVLVLDFGGGTTGMAVFEEGDILHCQILPVGSAHITNDIAIGLRTSVDVAEKIKIEYGSTLPGGIGKKEMIDLGKMGEEEGQVARHQVAEIIEARASEILDLVNKELKKIDRAGLLPAGVVLIGGGAKMRGLAELVKEKLKLPVQLGSVHDLEGVVEEIDDPALATVGGLIVSALQEENLSEGGESFKDLLPISISVNQIKKWFRGFMP